MKAILYTTYGPPEVLQLQEIEKPCPGAGEVLVQVHASSINAIEWRRFTMPRPMVRIFGGGLLEPKDKTIGGDLAGRVEAVGEDVKRFRPGDEVFGVRRGAFAEYVCATEDKLVHKPANVSFEAAATVPIAGLTALQALRDKGKIQTGQNVLIYGSGGGVGTFAVQIAKSFGTEVTAVCGPRNVEIARCIGADHVIDYSRGNFSDYGQQFDLIVGVNGYHSIFDFKRALKPDGKYVMVGGTVKQLLQAMFVAPFLSKFGSRKMLGMMTRPTVEDLIVLKDLLEAGKIVPAIDRCFPLTETVDAIHYVLDGHPRGKVVLSIA